MENPEAKYVVVKKPPVGFFASIRSSILEMLPPNSTAETEDLHKGGWAIPIVLIKQLAFAALLIAFTVINTEKEMQKKFLSLTGSIAGSQICETVANPLNTHFTGDRFGAWDSNANFTASGGFYVLTFGGSEVDDSTYARVMDDFTQELKMLGAKSEERDLSFSILALSSWSVHDTASNMEFTLNSAMSHIFSNFVFLDAGVYTGNGRADNGPGGLGGGVRGFSFGLSSDSKMLQLTYPLSQCTPASQVGSVVSVFRANAVPSTQTLTVLPASAVLLASTNNYATPWIVSLGPVAGGGVATNDMQIIWGDTNYDPNSVYVLQQCDANALTPPPAGDCILRNKASFKAYSDGISTNLYILSNLDNNQVSTVKNGMTIFGDQKLRSSTSFKAYSGGGNSGNNPGESSSTLTITSGSVANGLIFVNSDTTVVLDQCSTPFVGNIDVDATDQTFEVATSPAPSGNLVAGMLFTDSSYTYVVGNGGDDGTFTYTLVLTISSFTYLDVTPSAGGSTFKIYAVSNGDTINVNYIDSTKSLTAGDSFVSGVLTYKVLKCTSANGQNTITDSDVGSCTITANTPLASGQITTYRSCSMSSPQVVPVDSTIYGYARTVSDCKLSAQFDASTPFFTVAAMTTSTTLTVTKVDADGILTAGVYFLYSGATYKITSCTAGGPNPTTIDSSTTCSPSGTCTCVFSLSLVISSGVQIFVPQSSTLKFTATALDATLTVTQVDTGGSLTSGEFVYSGVTYTISSCNPATIDSAHLGTCALSSSLTLAAGTQIPITTTTLKINSIASGEVVDGMVISVGKVSSVLSSCSTPLKSGNSGTCTLSTSVPVVSGSTFTVDGTGKCTLSSAPTATFGSLTPTGGVALQGYVRANVTLATGTQVQGTSATVSSLSDDHPIDDGATIAGVGLPTGITLSGCQRWAKDSSAPSGYSLAPCALLYQASISEDSEYINVKDSTGLFFYSDYKASHPELVPDIGMIVKCQNKKCGIQDGTTIVAIWESTFVLSKPATKSDSSVKIIFSGVSSKSFVKDGKAGTFKTSVPITIGNAALQGVSNCKPAKSGLSGFFDPQYFDPVNNLNYVNRDGANQVTFAFDMQSVATSLAVNRGIVNVDTLSHVNVSNPQSFDGLKYGDFFNDHHYVPMDPIFCLKESDASKGSSCLLSQENMLFYPFMITVDPTDFSECKCSPSGDSTLNEEGNPTKTSCEVTPQIMIALVTFPDDVGSDGLSKGDGSGNMKTIAFAKAMLDKFIAGGGYDGGGDLKIYDFAYPAINSIISGDYNVDTGHFNNFDELCKAADGKSTNCGLFLTTFIVTPDQFMSINNVGMQLTALQKMSRQYALVGADPNTKYFSLACTNDVYVPGAMKSLSSRTPVKLTQPYYKCSATTSAAVLAAFGSASGSANTITGAVVTILLSLAIMQINSRNKKKGQPGVLPPLKKSMKARDEAKFHVQVLRQTLASLIAMEELKLPPEKKRQILAELETNFHDLKDDEDRVPVALAEKQHLELIDLNKTDDKTDEETNTAAAVLRIKTES